MGIKIITDSAADLPKDLAEEYGIEVVPLMVLMDNQEYLDGETMESKDLFQGMREGKVYKTAQVKLHTFIESFTEHARKGNSCIYVAFSSGLSGTYQTSLLAREEVKENVPDFDLEIVDTKCASLGFGLVVLQAARMAREGKTKGEILQSIRFHAEHMEHIFTVDQLDYLYRGGRVSKTAAVIGGLLNIKPLLHVEDGKLVPLEKIRGRKKVFERMVQLMAERRAVPGGEVIGISHGDDREGAEQLLAMLDERFGPQHCIISMIGGAVGAHSGPGTIALFFLNSNPES